MSAVTSIGSLFPSAQIPVICEPDSAVYVYGEPASGFVLCRDKCGNATAIYGESVWDFNPYRLGAKKISRIKFHAVFEGNDEGNNALIDEAKYIIYCLIYFSGGGRLGPLSASTLLRYWSLLRSCIQFCDEQKHKQLIGKISLQQLFSVPVYLAAFISGKKIDKSALAGLLGCLVRVTATRLGYSVLNPKNFDLRKESYNQCPVIPTRIYLGLINAYGDLLDQLYEGFESLESFIKCFADEHYGIAYAVQKSRGLGGKSNHRPDLQKAINDHKLTSLFSGEFSCRHKRNLQNKLIIMQFVCKSVIHIYTGMRDQEVMRMPYNCLLNKVISPAVFDDQGILRDKPQVVNILSTTTKYTGYKKEDKWYAPYEVIKAIEVAQAICRGLAELYQVELSNSCPLFLNPSIVGTTRKKAEVGVTIFLKEPHGQLALRGLLIQAEDLQELAQSDPTRAFYNEAAFAIGQPWPLTSHQFRRSLAFYGSSSGFLSLPTLRTQFKHMTIEMSRYYTNHYENLRTIFGYYDENQKDFVLPPNHFAFEYQMAIPMSVANQLIADLLFDEEPLFGGTGSYMEKQKERAKAGEIHLEDIRSDTIQRVKTGAISYRPTLLGGCTKVGRCDYFLLGNYTECLSCEGAIIKPDKLNSAIEDATVELCNYTAGSGEYQIVQKEIERLTSFKARIAGTAGCL